MCRTTGLNNAACCTTVHWNQTTIHVIVVHLGLFHQSRVRQTERVAELALSQIPVDALWWSRATSMTGTRSWITS